MGLSLLGCLFHHRVSNLNLQGFSISSPPPFLGCSDLALLGAPRQGLELWLLSSELCPPNEGTEETEPTVLDSELEPSSSTCFFLPLEFSPSVTISPQSPVERAPAATASHDRRLAPSYPRETWALPQFWSSPFCPGFCGLRRETVGRVKAGVRGHPFTSTKEFCWKNRPDT